MGPKTQMVEELRHLGGTREGEHAQRQRLGGNRPPVDKTWISGHAPRGAVAAQHAESQASVAAAARTAGEQRAAHAQHVPPHLENDALDRALRTLRDAGLSYRQFDRAVDLYVEHATRPAEAIAAVGGARMSATSVRAIERALLPPNNPNDDRAYYHALDLHAQGYPLHAAISTAAAEAAEHRRRRPPLHVQEHAIIPAPPPRAPRGFPQTAAQRRENRRDNVVAGIGIAVMATGLAALGYVLFGRKEPPTPPPAQPPPPVKPPARTSQPPPSQPRPSRGVSRP